MFVYLSFINCKIIVIIIIIIIIIIMCSCNFNRVYLHCALSVIGFVAVDWSQK
jgi:hypothetical protein